jgi:hypothetical protein
MQFSIWLTLLSAAASLASGQQTAPPGTPSSPGSDPSACRGDAPDAVAAFDMIPTEFYLATDKDDPCENPQSVMHHGYMAEQACRLVGTHE